MTPTTVCPATTRRERRRVGGAQAAFSLADRDKGLGPADGGLAPINGPDERDGCTDCSQWRNATEAPLADVLFTLIPVKLCCRSHRT